MAGSKRYPAVYLCSGPDGGPCPRCKAPTERDYTGARVCLEQDGGCGWSDYERFAVGDHVDDGHRIGEVTAVTQVDEATDEYDVHIDFGTECGWMSSFGLHFPGALHSSSSGSQS